MVTKEVYGCFRGDMKVSMGDGSYKRISEVRAGEDGCVGYC